MSEPQSNGADYYAKGSAELATESALLLNKLSHRFALTKGEERLVIVLVGLPGRGKSFISRKLQNFLQWSGTECKIFNVGKYRRQVEEGQGASADFFDTKNESAAALRQEAARAALGDLLNWIDEPFENGIDDIGRSSPYAYLQFEEPLVKGRVGIFDATNSTRERREWVLDQCTNKVKRADKPTGVIFIESVCDDPEIMHENLLTKISTSPDYVGVPVEEAMADVQNRCTKYEAAYETIDDDNLSYIKLFNLSSKMMVNHIYGYLAKSIVPALMAWNMGTRPIYLCRAAAEGDDGCPQQNSPTPLRGRKTRHTLVLCKQESLDSVGWTFSRALYEFMREECLDFKQKRGNQLVKPRQRGSILPDILSSNHCLFDVDDDDGPFPCHIATSTIPRARETVAWEKMPSIALSQINPLDKGKFTEKTMDAIMKDDPEWHARYLADPFHTRFPGGESQADLMLRLEPVAICLEQQVDPVLVVSHTDILQALVAYFRNSPAETCMHIDLPLNTVFKFTPAKGGGWQETRHCILSGEGGAK